jgi:hypothetical protein
MIMNQKSVLKSVVNVNVANITFNTWSGRASMSPSALLCPWAYDAVKTALHDIAEQLLIWSNTILTRSLDIGF